MEESNSTKNIFKALRICNDLSKKELAEKLNINTSYITLIEQGKKYPSLTLLKKYCQCFNISYKTFVLLEDDTDRNGWSYQEVLFNVLKILCNKE